MLVGFLHEDCRYRDIDRFRLCTKFRGKLRERVLYPCAVDPEEFRVLRGCAGDMQIGRAHGL
jgi:hypothetical protein